MYIYTPSVSPLAKTRRNREKEGDVVGASSSKVVLPVVVEKSLMSVDFAVCSASNLF